MYSMRLQDDSSVYFHVKAMTEIFENLAMTQDPVSNEDHVVYLLTSLPTFYSMFVTALKAIYIAKMPKVEHVIDMLLHKECKLKGKDGSVTQVQCFQLSPATFVVFATT